MLPIPGTIHQSMVLPDYDLLPPRIECHASAHAQGDAGEEPCTVAVFRFVLQRKWTWILVNHLLLNFLITSVGFYAFVIGDSETGDRAGVTLTLLLTVMASKLVVADSLPKLGYLTMLDKYMMACLSLLLGLAAGNAVVGTLDPATFTLSDRSRALFNFLCTIRISCSNPRC